jgi:hypothetical protein
MIFQPNTLQVQGGGTWSYEDNENDDEFCAVVLLADGSFAHIEHLSVHELTKMLGLMTCLSGCNKGAIKYMLTKSIDWWDMIQVGKLSQQYVWFILVKHFWLRVLYGLRTVSTSYNKLLECLMKVYCQIHLQLGIQSLARRGIRQLDLRFYSIGFPHPAIECLIAQLNKLLVHYGNQSCFGIKMQITLELLVIELGMSPQPFQEEYKSLGDTLMGEIGEGKSLLLQGGYQNCGPPGASSLGKGLLANAGVCPAELQQQQPVETQLCVLTCVLT